MTTLPPDPRADLEAKREVLRARLQDAGRLLIAFSGGVDSSYLAYEASQVLGPDCLAVTALSPSYPKVQRDMAEQITSDFSIPHRFIEAHEMDNEDYRANKPDRCYHCKSELFERIDELLEKVGFESVAYGINCDDRGDFRPGHRAADEHHVLTPLLDAGLGKAEIRALSREAGLPTAELPASACLASRLPYGTRVTSERLSQVEQGEDLLRSLGFRQVRLRHHGPLARIEIAPDELPRALDAAVTEEITRLIKPLGFRWVALDLEGYRTGSLNEALPDGGAGDLLGNQIGKRAGDPPQ
jgi:uncharacterized protein